MFKVFSNDFLVYLFCFVILEYSKSSQQRTVEKKEGYEFIDFFASENKQTRLICEYACRAFSRNRENSTASSLGRPPVRDTSINPNALIFLTMNPPFYICQSNCISKFHFNNLSTKDMENVWTLYTIRI